VVVAAYKGKVKEIATVYPVRSLPFRAFGIVVAARCHLEIHGLPIQIGPRIPRNPSTSTPLVLYFRSFFFWSLGVVSLLRRSVNILPMSQ
jgi:hypothetical protein